MNKRKTIALITANSTGIYSHRVVDGVLAQCEKSGQRAGIESLLGQGADCRAAENYRVFLSAGRL